MSEASNADPSAATGNMNSRLEFNPALTVAELANDISQRTYRYPGIVLLGTNKHDGLSQWRPYAVGRQDGAADIMGLNSDAHIEFVPIHEVAGLEDIEPSTVGAEPGSVVISFRYFKQKTGLESQRRIMQVTSIGYGVHEGHRGEIAEDGSVIFSPEKPDFYFVGLQLGTMPLVGGEPMLQEPAERVFPFARTGISGDINDPAFRSAHNLY